MGTDKRFSKDQPAARAEAMRQLQAQGDPRPAISLDLSKVAANLPGAPSTQPGAQKTPAQEQPQGPNTVFGIRPRRVQSGDDIAQKLGWQAAGKGNSVFGAGETLYVNPSTGEKRWASQFEE